MLEEPPTINYFINIYPLLTYLTLPPYDTYDADADIVQIYLYEEST